MLDLPAALTNTREFGRAGFAGGAYQQILSSFRLYISSSPFLEGVEGDAPQKWGAAGDMCASANAIVVDVLVVEHTLKM